MKSTEYFIENASKPFHKEVMLEAKDLRIGNWVEFPAYNSDNNKPHYSQIKGIYDNTVSEYDNCYYDDNSIEISKIEPIPLTPSILEKCGFVIKEWGNVYYHHRNIDLTRDFCLAGYDGVIKLKYLHQLQNLYFALTGEELQINL